MTPRCCGCRSRLTQQRVHFCDECRRPWRNIYRYLHRLLGRKPDRDEIRERLYWRRQGLV